MRPEILTPLFASLEGLPGIGAKTLKAFARLVGREAGAAPRVLDLVFHLPVGVLDRSLRATLAEAPRDVLVTVEVTVERHRAGGRQGAPHRVFTFDDTGDLTLVFFSPRAEWIEKALPVGARRWVSGKIETYDGML